MTLKEFFQKLKDGNKFRYCYDSSSTHYVCAGYGNYNINGYLDNEGESIITFNGAKIYLKGIKNKKIVFSEQNLEEINANIDRMLENEDKNNKRIENYKISKAKKDLSPLGIIKNYCIEKSIDYSSSNDNVMTVKLTGSKLRIYGDSKFQLNNKWFENKVSLSDPSNRKITAITDIIDALEKVSVVLDEISNS